jgi:hypothetical protein
MAAAAAKKTAPEEFKAPEGFDVGGTPEVDGWYKPEIGSIVHGKIVGHMSLPGENGRREVILIKLRTPCKGYQKGDDTGKELSKGDVLGLGVSYDIRDALKYVENRGEVYIVPREKKKLGGKKTMWKFDQAYKGIKATPPVLETSTDSGTGDDDDIPF